jgi:stage II sporulation protein E
MLNHYLRARASFPEDECSSTVDLFSLDLYTGQGQFIKSGAAPSLILRDGRLYRLISHTVPIGILQAIDMQVIPFEVRPGDHILLFSDGITDTTAYDEHEPSGHIQNPDDWLTDFLSNDIPKEDDVLIDRLVELAREHGSSDDISVISLRISEQQQKSERKE